MEEILGGNKIKKREHFFGNVVETDGHQNVSKVSLQNETGLNKKCVIQNVSEQEFLHQSRIDKDMNSSNSRDILNNYKDVLTGLGKMPDELHIFMNKIPWLTASKCRVPNFQDLYLNTLIVIRLFLKLESYTYFYDDISSLSNKYPISNSLFSFGNSFMCVVFFRSDNISVVDIMIIFFFLSKMACL